MSVIQPISPYEPNTSVLLAIENAPQVPEFPTTPAIAATAPIQTLSEFNAIKQLPSYTLTSMVSQQAVTNNNLSQVEKINQGILNSVAGVSFSQLSTPGQSIKPGAGEFLKNVQQSVPSLPLDLVAPSNVMTGFCGVKNINDLTTNVTAQVNAVTNSFQQATTGLTNSGILNGKENPTQIAGVVMAAATQGVSAVTNALKNPLSVASNIGGIGNKIGAAIAGGTFAAGLADKLSSGAAGLASSLSGVASGALSALSSGITGFVGKAAGGLGSLISGFGGVAQNAFNLAEKSFGTLKAGVPNSLGGLPETVDKPISKVSEALRTSQVADEELAAALAELKQARKAYSVEESAETYAAIREAEAKVAAADQKAAKASEDLMTAADAGTDSVLQKLSTQNLSAVASAAASGTLKMPNVLNTGINALPGGFGAFATQIGGVASNVMSTVKNIGGSITSALSNPSKIVGNLVSNVQNTINGALGNIANGINNIGNKISGALTNATSALTSVASNAIAGASGLISNITSSLSSLGNMPGQIKSAIVSIKTAAEIKAQVNATLAQTLDPIVPPTVFEEIVPTVEEPDVYLQQQTDAQLALEELYATREAKAAELEVLIERYASNNEVELITEIDSLRSEIATVDKDIVAAQDSYDKIVSG